MLPGAEPFSAVGGPEATLVLHGFSGNPSTIRGLAERLADAGLTVEAPLLPGHGTRIEDLVDKRWADWSAAAEEAYADLAARSNRVAVVGLSMGGTLACWLAEHHQEPAGLVVVNPFLTPADEGLRQLGEELLAAGEPIAPGIGSDIAKPGVTESAYQGTPIEAVLSLAEAAGKVGAGLADVRCPSLLFSSRQDHIVPTASGDLFEATVGGPCERIWLERSYHVATLDYDADEVEERTVAFVTAVTGGAER